MVTVIQVGARHHYAIPRMLHNAGQLDQLITDTCPGVGFLSRVTKWIPKFLLPSRISRWATRAPTGFPVSKIKTIETSAIFELLASKGYLNDHWDQDGKIFRSFERGCLRSSLVNSEIVYGMLFESSPEFFKQAKAEGKKTILDVYITPTWHQITWKQRKRFPEWEGSDKVQRDAFEQRVIELIAIADILLCPGENVVDGLRQFDGFDESKVRILPYGCGIDFEGAANAPSTGRVLFAGSANLRKGLPYLAQAATILKVRGRHYDFRVAGNVDDLIREMEMCSDLNFLGRVPRPEMKQEFLRADVMVFPTLAEGCAGVVHESLFAGLPVITTKASGSVIESGRGGLIVPEADAESLADAIEAVVEDRSYRNQLAEGTASYRNQLSEEAWESGLIKVVNELLD